MDSIEYKSAVDLLAANAPPEWVNLRVRYRCYDGAMDLNAEFRTVQDDTWKHLSFDDFRLMDFFENYREKTINQFEKPWTEMMLTTGRSIDDMVIAYEYGIPNILDRGA